MGNCLEINLRAKQEPQKLEVPVGTPAVDGAGIYWPVLRVEVGKRYVSRTGIVTDAAIPHESPHFVKARLGEVGGTWTFYRSGGSWGAPGTARSRDLVQDYWQYWKVEREFWAGKTIQFKSGDYAWTDWPYVCLPDAPLSRKLIMRSHPSFTFRSKP